MGLLKQLHIYIQLKIKVTTDTNKFENINLPMSAAFGLQLILQYAYQNYY